MIPVYKAMDFLVLQIKPKSALLVGNKTCILEFETTNLCYLLTCKLSTPDCNSRNIAYLCKRSWKNKVVFIFVMSKIYVILKTVLYLPCDSCALRF